MSSEHIVSLDALPWFELASSGTYERPPDPMAYRVRTLMDRYLTPRHKQVLEDIHFLNKSIASLATEYGCDESSVRGLRDRAARNLVKVIAEHGLEVTDVPEDEL